MNLQFTGLKFFTDLFNISSSNILAAFSFYSGFRNNNIVYPESWATNSASGILNNTGSFFNTIGTGFFNGQTYMNLNKNYSLDNSIIFISYEKLRQKNEILLSSATGNNFSNYSGFCLGINDANKLYFTYWNPVEGPFTFTYSKILSDKNLIFLNKYESTISLGCYNTNTFSFDVENFNIFRNAFRSSDKLFIGGKPNNIEWLNEVNNLSGYIDKFYIINDQNAFNYKNEIVSGFFSITSGVQQQTSTECYLTGFISGSGFTYFAETGRIVSGFLSGIPNQITGYTQNIFEYTYEGITGYQTVSNGFYTDSCGDTIERFTQLPLYGQFVISGLETVPLSGTIFITGYREIRLSGFLSGIRNVYVTGEVCYNILGDVTGFNLIIDQNYLKSLSYKEITLFSKPNVQSDIIEIYTEPYQVKTLEYNKNLFYDNLNQNYFYIDRAYSTNEILLFGNGQALIDSGYQLIPDGYEIIRSPNLDYFITGTTIETNKFFVNEDSLFYDYFSGDFWASQQSGGNIIFPEIKNDNYWVFKNGQKLIKNKDYTVNLSGSNYSLQSILNSPIDSFLGQWGTSMITNIDGSILVVADQQNFENGVLAGAAYIYTKNAQNEYIFKQKITGSNGITMGTSIDMTDDGSIIILGAAGDNTVGLNAGSVLIYTGNINNNWTLKQKITGENSNDIFGRSVSINKEGTVFIVGADGDSQNGGGAGASFVFTGSSQNGWQLKQKLTGRALGGFGWRVRANDNGNVLMMSAPSDRSGPVFLAGAVFIYTGNPQNGWLLKQRLHGLQTNSQFGYDIDTNSDSSVLLVSCQNSNPSFVYTGNAINGWSLQAPLSYPSNDTTFGWNARVNKDGSILFLSSPGEDIPNSIDGGASFVYTGNSQNGWNLKQKLFIEDSSDDKFGVYITMNGDGSILMMNSRDYINNNNNGAIAIYGLDKRIEINDNNENYYIIKTIPDNFIYYSGNSGSLKLTTGFNHGCSQVYYNGIKQKIDNNYVENAIFDLISGNIHEFDFPIKLIYNNTDDFFV